MSDVIILHGTEVELGSSESLEFVRDCVRAGEALITDTDVRSKYEITDADWSHIVKSTALARAIRTESEKRVRLGIAAKEAAAKEFVRAPKIMGEILGDKATHPKFRIEAAKEIRSTAIGGDGTETPANAAEKFIITINLGRGHVETYEKDITPPIKQLPPGGDADWGWRER